MNSHNTKYYWLSTPIYTIRVDVQNDMVIFIAPIAKWAKGKKWDSVLLYYQKRFGEKLEVRELE